MLEELKTYIAVVENNSFTKAGEVTALSQPSVSLHVKRLEDYFNIILIQRSNKQKKFVITPAGLSLYEKAKQLIRMANDIKGEMNGYATGIKGRLHIGATLTIGEYFLPSFLGKFCAKYPDLEISITIENTEEICKKVKNMQVDVGLVEGRVESNIIASSKFYRDRLQIIAPVNWQIDSRSLDQRNWITREKGSGSRREWEQFMLDENLTSAGMMVFSTNFAVKEAVKNNLGLAMVSEVIAQGAAARGEIQIIETSKSYFRNFSYIQHEDYPSTKALEVFETAIKNNFS